ncbi:MAG: hypothetical protein H7A49_16865, partial [Akkermansiaceae bacterium]|nr:hypothetical protein [Akkermansiaceae bacterium]
MVTLSLMILLALLSVGLLSLATISLRTASSASATAEARANAKLALMMAIGQLQKTAGPDTRVTANAGLVNERTPNPHWTAVWKTRTDEDLAGGNPGKPMVDHHADSRYLTDSRVQRGRRIVAPDPFEWLVSRMDPKTGPNASADDSWVSLVKAPDEADQVRVPTIEFDEEKGRIGWWVSDENQKALVSLPDRNEKQAPAMSLVAAQDYDFETFEADGGTPLKGHADLSADQVESVATLATSSLLPLGGAKQFIDNPGALGHHLTTNARGLFVDVKNSGLKRDLSTFFARGDIADAEGLAGIRESDPIIPGEHHMKTSPRFGILKGWADLADELSVASGAASMQPRPPVTRFLSMSKSAPGPVADLVNVSKPAIEPVVIEASLGWDFSPYTKAGTSEEYVRGHIFPRLILWNPFNVTLTTTQYVVMLRHPLYGSFRARGAKVDSRGSRFYFDDVCGKPSGGFLGFVTETTTLEPGETKIFTPSVGDSAGGSLFGKAAEFDPVNFSANVLTSEQIPGIENFYWDSTVRLPAETTSNQYEPYGFSGDTNSFYCNDSGSGDEFIVCQTKGTSGGKIDFSLVTQDGDRFPRIGHFLCQNWGLNRYHKWYGAERNDHPSNNGTPFREFRPGAVGIGSLDNRRPPRLWRRGIRMGWIDDQAEQVATGGKVPQARYTVPWVASTNLRGGILHHGSWVNIPFNSGWQFPGSDSHIYFRQPTDPQTLSSFYPPSPFAAPDDSFPTRCTLFDIPRRETGVVSLGQLQHAQMSYFPWHPSLVIGHSQPTMNADIDATAIKNKVTDPNRWKGTKDWQFEPLIQTGSGASGHNNEVLVYDLCFEANEALWDRYMISSIPFSNGRPTWDLEKPLPVGRYVFNDDSQRWSREELRNEMASSPDRLFRHVAEFLAIDGAFNVNSTSVQAWKALLGAMRDMNRPSLSGGPSSGTHPLSRSVTPAMPGTTAIGSANQDEMWNAFRSLSDDELQTLSEQIV